MLLLLLLLGSSHARLDIIQECDSVRVEWHSLYLLKQPSFDLVVGREVAVPVGLNSCGHSEERASRVGVASGEINGAKGRTGRQSSYSRCVEVHCTIAVALKAVDSHPHSRLGVNHRLFSQRHPCVRDRACLRPNGPTDSTEQNSERVSFNSEVDS